MFSKTCEYAIRAVIFIAQRSGDGSKVGIKEIAKGIDSPEHFIAKILQDLSREGLVLSQKGPSGGFYLDKVCMKASLADVVKAVDGDDLFTGCGLGLKQCSETMPCPLHDDFKKIRASIFKKLQSTKVGAFNEQLAASLVYLSNG